MCGIAGFWANGQIYEPRAVAERMGLQLKHRGPDDSGVWCDPGMRLAMAHQRLSILDISSAGHQPMESRCGRYVVVFNGEIYNHLRLRQELDRDNFQSGWVGRSDTETLLKCISRWGVKESLRRIEGMFAFAVWDMHERELFLARDRMGEKPLYYGWQGDCFLFGSELKALKANPSFNAAVDRGALALLLRYNYVPTPYSIYQGIVKLAPGSFLKLDSSDIASQVYPEAMVYWSLTDIAQRGTSQRFIGSEAQALDLLEEKLSTAIRDQLLSDVPLGFLLSGGIDSSLVCALAQRISSQPIQTFSIGFEEKSYDESGYAKGIAARLGSNHTELIARPEDALELMAKLPTIYDEPFADSSQLPTYMVMDLVKHHVTVALSGDGGDELFGGYNRYQYAPGVWRWLSVLPTAARAVVAASLSSLPKRAIDRFAGVLGIAQLSDKAQKLGQRIRNARNIDDFYISLISEWSEIHNLVLNTESPLTLLDHRENWPRIDCPAERMMILDGLTYLPDDVLAKVDRAAMAVSLETRMPFLSPNVVEFAWRLPLDMKLRKGRSKHLLRQLLERYIPRDQFERPKMGFSVPLDQWLRGPLQNWAEALIGEQRLKREGYLDPAPIRRIWRAHLSGKHNYGYRLWSVLMFQLWLESQN